MKFALELFSGFGVFSQICMKKGYVTKSLDFNPKLNPDICENILSWQYQKEVFKPDVIWSSPDCRLFSRGSSLLHWKKEIVRYRKYIYTPISDEAKNAISLVEKTIEIIKYFNPEVWFIENPCGRLRHLKIIRDYVPYRYCVNYANWGLPYSKETDIYTNILLPFPSLKVIVTASSVASINNRQERARVPAKLIEFLLSYIN